VVKHRRQIQGAPNILVHLIAPSSLEIEECPNVSSDRPHIAGLIERDPEKTMITPEAKLTGRIISMPIGTELLVQYRRERYLDFHGISLL